MYTLLGRWALTFVGAYLIRAAISALSREERPKMADVAIIAMLVTILLSGDVFECPGAKAPQKIARLEVLGLGWSLSGWAIFIGENQPRC